MSKKNKIIIISAAAMTLISLISGILVAVLLPDNGGRNTTSTVATLGYGELKEANNLTNPEKIAGYVDVTDYGAMPDDNKDDTDAFEKAIKKNIAVYVPAGEYRVSRPLPLNSQNLFGDGENATSIISIMQDKSKPIFYLGGSSCISLISIGYDDVLITGKEKQTERVAISCGASVGFGPAGGIKDAKIHNVGTAIISDATDGFGSNNCTFDRINIEDFSYTCFDITVAAGYGSIYRQIYAESSYKNAKNVFTFSGSGGIDQVQNLRVKNTALENVIVYTQLSGVLFDEPIVENCQLSSETTLLKD